MVRRSLRRLGESMFKRAVAKAISTSLLLAMLTACGGGGAAKLGSSGSSSGGSSSSSSSSSGGSSSGSIITPVYKMGSFNSSGTFQQGVIAIGLTPLSAGGSSSLDIAVVDTANGNALYTTPATVTFNSICVSNKSSKITPSPVDTAGGAASVTYVAQGCSGNDAITASAIVGNPDFGTTKVSASGTINVLPASIGGIKFVSATPTTIGVRGSGQVETATVIFQVLNSSGGPVPGQTVNFALNTTTGGITLNPASGKTDGSGNVQTVVASGYVHTAVRVTATTTDATNSRTISSQSGQLNINTGIPDQKHFSLSIGCSNVSGGDIDGTKVGVTVFAADHFSNPVPDGTAVSFVAEGGSIEPSCNTVNGTCSVNWISQNPRPGAFSNGSIACSGPFSSNAQNPDASCANSYRAGRSDILATAIGEETYSDTGIPGVLNSGAGNGVFDLGESFMDLPEPFQDFNGNGTHESFEPFLDFNSNGNYDAPDGKYNGLSCNNSGTPGPCPAPRTTYVRGNNLIILSSDSPAIDTRSGGDVRISVDPGDATVSGNHATYDATDPSNPVITIDPGFSTTLSVVVRDRNNEPMPNAATIGASVSNSATIAGTASYTVPCTTDDTANGNTYRFSIKANDAVTPAKKVTGLLELKVTSRGLTTIQDFTVVTRAAATP